MTATTFDPRATARWRGRTRTQLERDVLVAALTVEPFRRRARLILNAYDFTTAAHAAIWTALSMQQPVEIVAPNVALATGCTIDQAEAWILGSSPITYDDDAALLIENR